MPEASLKEGNLPQTIERVKDRIRKEPAEAEHRQFLCYLLCLQGDWDKAKKQLDVAVELKPENQLHGLIVHTLMSGERSRAAAFAGDETPMILGEPAEWIATLIEALRLDAEGKSDEAEKLNLKAFEAAPEVSGSIQVANEAAPIAFNWFADADTRLGPVIEAFVNSAYYWIPVTRIRKIEMEAPSILSDFVWQPVRMELTTGGVQEGFLPSRYFGSEQSDDSRIVLARLTEWQGSGDRYTGLGQRMWTTDSGDYPLFDTRVIEFDNPLEESASEEPAEGEATE